MGTRKFKEFNQTSMFTTFKRLLVCTMIGCPTLTGMFVCPKTGIHWCVKLLFRTVVPISLGNFYLYACSKYVGHKAGLINPKEDLSDDETEKKTKKVN